VTGETEYKLKVSYKGGTPENKHPKKHPRGQHPPKYTSPPKTNSFTKTTSIKTISNLPSSLLTPQETPLQNKLILFAKAEPHPKSSYLKRSFIFHQLSTSDPPKGTIKRPKPNLSQRTDFQSRIKSDRPTRLYYQIKRAPLTLGIPEKQQIKPKKNAVRHEFLISKQN